MKNRLGIKEIAKIAGVSIGTVDRVLHNRSGVAEKTRDKILTIIKETGYQKNLLASRLKLAASKVFTIALLLPEIKNDWSYWNLPLKGVHKAIDELKEQGISVQVFHFISSKPNTFKTQCNRILQQNFDAVVTVPFLIEESNQFLELAAEQNRPVVFLDSEAPLDHPTNFIRQNSYNAGKVAGRLLYGLAGKEGVYVVMNILTERGIQINNQQRENGFRAFFTENLKGVEVPIFTLNQPLDEKIFIPDDMRPFLKTDKPKGIFVTNSRSYLLPPILNELKVPNTYIIGFDLNQKNLEFLKNDTFQFLINQKPEYQGYAAIKGLYKYLTLKDTSDLNIDIPVEIIVKENIDSYVGW